MAVAKLVADFEYTDAEILALLREAFAKVAAGAEETEVLGKKYRRSNIDALQRMIDVYQAKVNRASTRSPHTYTRFRRDP